MVSGELIKKIKYDGRLLEILNKDKQLNQKYLKKFTDKIEIFFKTNEFVKHFPKITIYLEPSTNEKRAWVDPHEVQIGLTRIHLNPKKMWFGTKKTLIHELAHILHFSTSGWIEKQLRQLNKTRRVFEKKFLYLEDTADIREKLITFIYLLQAEGFAHFFENFTENPNVLFNKKYSWVVYWGAKRAAKKNQKLWKKYLWYKHKDSVKSEKLYKSLIKRLSYSSHDIGHHMAYTLVSFGGFKDKEIISFTPQTFVKKYEKVMKIKGLQPVVSLTSSKGILDYKQMVAEWWAVAKKNIR